MTIFLTDINWNSPALMQQITEYLEPRLWSVDTALGFNDDFDKSAFIITAKKEKFVMLITIENQEEQVVIKGGIDGKYLPEGKKIPKYKGVFPKSKLLDAHKLFVEIIENESKENDKFRNVEEPNDTI